MTDDELYVTKTGRTLTDADFDALAAEAEQGYWCREPIGEGKTCNKLGKPIENPPTPDRIVLCEQHRKGWGREL
jgi:hypothetical protein